MYSAGAPNERRRHKVSPTPIWTAGWARRRVSERLYLASRVSPAGDEPKQSHRVAKAAVAAPGLGLLSIHCWTSVYADAPPNRGGVPSGPTCPMAGVADPGVPTLPVPGWELPVPLAGGGGVPGVPMEPALAALPADGGGGVPGVPTLPVPGWELPVPLAGGGGVPGVPMEPAPAALPADGGGGVPGVPTLPAGRLPATRAGLRGDAGAARGRWRRAGSSHGARVIDACGRPASSLMIVVPLLVPEPPGLPGVSGSYGVALSSTLLGVGKAPRFGVRRLPLSLPVTPALPPLASAPASPALDWASARLGTGLPALDLAVGTGLAGARLGVGQAVGTGLAGARLGVGQAVGTGLAGARLGVGRAVGTGLAGARLGVGQAVRHRPRRRSTWRRPSCLFGPPASSPVFSLCLDVRRSESLKVRSWHTAR